MLLELNKKIFGKITTKEIIGAKPPAIPDTKNILEKELTILLVELESQSKENLSWEDIQGLSWTLDEFSFKLNDKISTYAQA